jgi:sugar phosphate isomerase/epimerase
MANFKIGVITNSFRVPDWREQIRIAKQIGADGVQLYNINDDLDPAKLSQSGREEVKQYVASLGLEISAICGDEGFGFANPETVEKAIARAKEFLKLSVDLGPGIVTTHIGTIPDDPEAVAWKTMAAALEELGPYADKVGGVLATETGPEEPELMVKFFKSLKTNVIRVNYDPANLTMRGFDAVKGVYTLRDYIVHTHAKDGVIGDHEVALGDGDVDWPNYLKALKEINYQGLLDHRARVR